MVNQVFLDAMDHGYFHMKRTCLIIVDECHHAFGNSACAQIFKNHYAPLKAANPQECPRILALSASIVPNKCEMSIFLKRKKELEVRLDSTVITAENLGNLLRYVANPSVEISVFGGMEDQIKLFNAKEACIEDMRLIYEQHVETKKNRDDYHDGILKENTERKFKKYKRQISSISDSITMLGIHCANEQIRTLRDMMNEEKLKSNEEFEKDMIDKCITFFDQIYYLLEPKEFVTSSDIAQICTSKVIHLMDILRNPFPDRYVERISMTTKNKQKLVGIVFVQQRCVASSLSCIVNEFVKQYPQDFGHIKVDWCVGGTDSESYKMPAAQKWAVENECRQKMNEKLLRFRKGEINLMIATEVLEEGLDVSKCNLVVRFDDIPNFRAFVQSKGRARARNEANGHMSRYIVVVNSEEESKIRRSLENYMDLEGKSIELCHRDPEDTSSDESDDNDTLYSNPKDKMNSPRVTKHQSITIIYRFIQLLPTDRYTKLRPYFKVIRRTMDDRCTMKVRNCTSKNLYEREDNPTSVYSCELYMPHLTPYAGKPFISRSCSDPKTAKQLAALKACKALLDDRLLPEDLLPKKRKFDETDDDEDDALKRRGTKNFKDYYQVSLVKDLSYNQNKLGHLYKFDSVLSKEAEFTKNSPHRPEEYDEKIGVIVTSELPLISLSRNVLYTLSGEVTVQLVYCGLIELPKILNSDIIKFQEYVWGKIVGCVTPWMKYDAKEKGLIIVPLDKASNIDQVTLKNVANQSVGFGDERMENELFIFDEKNYENVVISPVHQNAEEHYFVEEVMTDTSPNTLIDEKSHETFREYYKRNYNRDTTDLTQQLLRVSGADHRHFMYREIALKGASRSRSKSKDHKFLPELVLIQPLKASLWKECQLLPFVLNRISSLIMLENLREEISYTNDMLQTTEVQEFDQPTFHDLISKLNNVKHPIPSSHDLLKAFTLAGASENFNMERLEILGDVFLKYIVGNRMFCDSITNLHVEEGMLTKGRSKIVGNRKLFQTAIDNNFCRMINARKLEPYLNFMPPGFTQNEKLEETIRQMDEKFQKIENQTETKGSKFIKKDSTLRSKHIVELLTKDDIKRLSDNDLNEDIQRELISKASKNELDDDFSVNQRSRYNLRQYVRIGDKYLADVIEAVIGLFLEKGGQGAALQFMKFLKLDASGMIGKEDFPTSAYLPHAVEERYVKEMTLKKTNYLLQQIDCAEIERKINYSFKEKSFLVQALTHASYIGNRITPSYERLEFLGDGILDYLVTCFLYTNGGNMEKTPGEITELRSALVQNNAFASIVIKAGLEKHILHESPEIMNKINECRDQILQPTTNDLGNTHIDSELLKLKAEELLQHIKYINEEDCPELINIEVPKVLGDILESIVGAIYIDSGMDLDTVWRAYTHLFSEDEILKVINEQPKHPVKEVTEKFSGNFNFHSPEKYNNAVAVVLKITISEGSTQETLKFKGIGRNATSAKYAAAKCCLREFDKGLYRNLNQSSNNLSQISVSNQLWVPSYLKSDISDKREITLQNASLKKHVEAPLNRIPVFSKLNTFSSAPGNGIWSEASSSNISIGLPIDNESVKRISNQESKNPISALQEKCSKHGWPLPKYEIVRQDGPPHMRRFMFQVKLQGKNYCDPTKFEGSKQKAKASAAAFALSNM